MDVPPENSCNLFKLMHVHLHVQSSQSKHTINQVNQSTPSNRSIKSIKVYHQSNQSLTSGKQCTVVTGKNGYTKCKCIPKIICNHNHNTSNTTNHNT